VETVLYRFPNARGAPIAPNGGLIAGDGVLYGTTSWGGNGNCPGASGFGCGAVFKITPTGKLTVLHRFDDQDGAFPLAGLIEVNGILYGTTDEGGTGGNGTVFELTTSGHEKVLYSFTGFADGAQPSSSLIYYNGLLYGTSYGGVFNEEGYYSPSTIFRLTPSGTLTVLHSFPFNPHNDSNTLNTGLTLVNGVFYGTTVCGAFSVTPSGKFTWINKDLCPKGTSYGSFAPLIAVGDILYGTLVGGPQSGPAYGAIFSLTTSGTLTVLATFTNSATQGNGPASGLVYGNGVLYGTTTSGGSTGSGNVFALPI
jgi:uncharacterized repeat protein (TIGR03803 family)